MIAPNNNELLKQIESMIHGLNAASVNVGPIPPGRWRASINPRLFEALANTVPVRFTGLQWVIEIAEGRLNLILDPRIEATSIHLVNPRYNRAFIPSRYTVWRIAVGLWVNRKLRGAVK